ncbi:MAG: hypothetical protein LBR70_05700 [Lactobacillaceae bacterium]|jgi:hypothetical protein|nr:hypothetical protein [Lactobacillaceae bacterium]
MNIIIKNFPKVIILTMLLCIFNISNALSQTTAEICHQQGYKLAACDPGFVSRNHCPNDGMFFEKCVCDTDIFKFNEENCASPKVLNGEKCENNYKNCSCPEDYTKLCVSPLVGEEPGCEGRYKRCVCKEGFRSCYPAMPTAECREETGEIKYMDCKVF